MVNTRSTKETPTTEHLTDSGVASAANNSRALDDTPRSPTDSHNNTVRTIVNDRQSKYQRSRLTSSSVKRRQEAEFAAAERLADVEREQVKKMAEIEKNLIRLRLQAELQAINSDDEASEDGEGSRREETTRRRTEDWVRESSLPQPRAPPPPPAPVYLTQECEPRPCPPPDAPPQCSNGGALYCRQAVPMPSFDGKTGDWLAYRSAYDEQKHRFTKLENLARLRRSLTGEAKAAVCHQLIGQGDPDEVMQTLNGLFGRPDQIVELELTALRRLPKMTDVPKQIHTFASQLRNSIAALCALGQEDYLRSVEIVQAIKSKIEPLMSKYIDYDEVHQNDSAPEIKRLCDFLKKEAEKISRSWKLGLSINSTAPARPAHIPMQPRARAQDSRGAMVNTRQPNHTTCTTTETDSTPPTGAVCCTMCDSTEHYTYNCGKFKRASSDEKWEHVRAAQLCFRCLKRGHHSRMCRSNKGCTVSNCGRRHHTLLHNTQQPSGQTTPTQAAAHNVAEIEGIETVACAHTDDRALLKILPVKIYGPRGSASTYALLDDGSTVTLIDEDLAKKIGADGPRTPMTLDGLNSSRNAPESRRVMFDISGTSGEKLQVNDARTITRLALTTQSTEKIDEMSHLRGLPILAYADAKPQLLIGQDNWHLLVTSEVRRSKFNEPVASLTALGWVLHGHTGGSRRRQNRSLHVSHFVGRTTTTDHDIGALVEEHFKIDSLGISTKERQNASDKRALDILHRTCHKDGGRWEAGLLWNEDNIEMPPSYNSALKRLRTLEKKMDNDKTFGEAYEKQMNRLIDAEYAAPAPSTNDKKKWFLPHFAVTNVNKPGKIRIVFDAAARVNGRSLNDALLTGPDLLQSLLGVLYKFREGRFAVSADIAEMFLRIRIARDDRPAQRFLWRGWDRTAVPTEFEMSSMIFGAASSPTTAIHVKNKNAEEFKEKYPVAVQSIEKNFYMDDYLQSFETSEEAESVARAVSQINDNGGFHLTGWASNDPTLLQKLDPSRTNETRDLISQTATQQKTLGLRWNPDNDTLGFNLNMARVPRDVATGERRPTKRQMLSVIMSIYDPIGLLTPVIVRGKVIMQQVWRAGTGWDDPLPDRESGQWSDWLKLLHSSGKCRVPRCYFGDAALCEIQMHVFCDASEDAYAAAVYFRFTQPNGRTHTTLIGGKSRVAPLKPTSIPRLELQAALLGSRLAATIVKEHTRRPTKKIFWTDSRTVLAWINSDARDYKSFVSHRLAEIDELTNASEWRWVPTEENVADDATRHLNGLDDSHRWFHGPEFLRQEEGTWPTQPIDIHRCNVELRSSETAVVHAIDARAHRHSLPEPARFSRWLRLLRAAAYVYLFIEKCRRRHTGRLERHHVEQAEHALLQQTQEDAFAAELACLRAGLPLPRGSRLKTLAPYLDSVGTMRLRGRVSATPGIERQTAEPIILCGRHHVTRLLVLHFHIASHHEHNEAVINLLRERYWVVNLRPTVRTVARDCQVCRIRKVTAQAPPMGDLPEARLNHHHRPFTYMGVDYFGPIDVAVGRRREKRYCALFTCLVTRAVHLEVAAGLTTDSAINALRRMIARRGSPTTIYSDNGTNFHGADAELRRAWTEIDVGAVQTFALTKGADWRFIPPSAPFMGGAWERLVGTIRRALRATLHQRAPTDEVLTTLLAEAEHTVNARPLTHVSVDPADPEALTPNHFLLGSASGAPTPGSFDDSDLARRRQWRAAQRLADIFWERWMKEYLPTLLPRSLPSDDRPELRRGDLVVIVDPTLPRNIWPRGIIERVLPGRDGHVRVADVRTRGGVLRRPARKIARLPVHGVVGDQPTTGGRMWTTGNAQAAPDGAVSKVRD